MSKQIYQGTKKDFEVATKGMHPIKNIPEINKLASDWWIHPRTACIVHLIKIEEMFPFEPKYYFTQILYNPKENAAFNRSGRKQVKIGGKTYSLARLVAATFVQKTSPERNIVWHKNKNSKDCRADNLEWVTKKELYENRKKPYKGKIFLILENRL